MWAGTPGKEGGHGDRRREWELLGPRIMAKASLASGIRREGATNRPLRAGRGWPAPGLWRGGDGQCRAVPGPGQALQGAGPASAGALWKQRRGSAGRLGKGTEWSGREREISECRARSGAQGCFVGVVSRVRVRLPGHVTNLTSCHGRETVESHWSRKQVWEPGWRKMRSLSGAGGRCASRTKCHPVVSPGTRGTGAQCGLRPGRGVRMLGASRHLSWGLENT